MPVLRLAVAGSACLLAIGSCSLPELFGLREDFITVRDHRLIHRGEPYVFCGANMWYGMYLGTPGSTGNRDRLIRELDRLKDLGVSNLRILAASEHSAIRRSVRPAVGRIYPVQRVDWRTDYRSRSHRAHLG